MNFLSQLLGVDAQTLYARWKVLDRSCEMSERSLTPPFDFDDLLNIMKQLRTPNTGCAWDLEQRFDTIAPYTIEEAYEVADAIARKDMSDLSDELGDLLLQVVFHAQIATDEGHFSIADVTQAICDKMIRRHPHVFRTLSQRSSSEQIAAWEDIKAAERSNKSKTDSSALAGVAVALPALMRSEKLQKRAARTGFDWTDPKDIFDKLDEELEEVREAIDEGDADHIEEEIGDFIFVAVNLARRLDIDPEVALRKANDKFERRFRAMEARAKGGEDGFAALDLEAQEALWQAVKRDEA